MISTIKYRLKTLYTTAHGIIFFALALVVAFSPFIGLIIPDAPIPIGWIDEDNSDFSKLLLENVQALDVVCVFEDDEDTLIANLQTGRIEGVFVIKEGFEQAVKQGEFEETLQMLRSPYSTAAGVISESVGGEAMRLWLTCYSANEAQVLGGDALYNNVFEDVNAGTDIPILSLARQNAEGETDEVTPLLDASFSSLYLLAAFVAFFMLSGLSLIGKNRDLSARLKSRGFSVEMYRLSTSIADRAFILPPVAIPLVGFGMAGAGKLIIPLFIMFALYVLAFGGIASIVCKMQNQTVLMLLISVITIANVMFGSLLIPLPSTGLFGYAAYVLPASWLSSIESVGPMGCIAGLCGCAIVYNALPFLLKKKEV